MIDHVHVLDVYHVLMEPLKCALIVVVSSSCTIMVSMLNTISLGQKEFSTIVTSVHHLRLTSQVEEVEPKVEPAHGWTMDHLSHPRKRL